MPWMHQFREHGWSGVIVDAGLTARPAEPSHWSRAAAAVEHLDFGTVRSSASVGRDRHPDWRSVRVVGVYPNQTSGDHPETVRLESSGQFIDR
jgi:hypothetical protein